MMRAYRTLAALLPILVSCSGGAEGPGETPNPVPTLHGLVPSLVFAGTAAFTLRVHGAGFTTGSAVRWDGVARATTLQDDTTLVVQVSAGDVAAVDSIAITVSNPPPGGGTSSALTLAVRPYVPPAVPSIADLQPPMVLAGAAGFALEVYGDAFTDSSVVRWNGADRPTTFVRDGWVSASIPASDVATVGSADVTVHTPGAPGASSAARPFAIVSPAPGHPHAWGRTVIPVPGGPWLPAIPAHGAAWVGRSGAAAVARIDLATATLLDGIDVGSHPYDIAFDSAGTTAYLTTDSAHVAVYDATTTVRTAAFPVAIRPRRVRPGPGGTKLYVSLIDGTLAVLDAAGGALRTTVPVEGVGNGLALTPNGSRLWVSTNNGMLVEVATDGDTLARRITVGGTLQDVVVTPDGAALFAASPNGFVYAYDVATLARLDSIPVPGAFGLAVTPDGSQVWATETTVPYLVAVIDVATRKVVGSLFMAVLPRGVAFSPDGSTALLTYDPGFAVVVR